MIIATSGNRLLDTIDDKYARILIPDEGFESPPQLRIVIIAHGYWTPVEKPYEVEWPPKGEPIESFDTRNDVHGGGKRE